jgi:hypothetical protein
MTEKCSEYHVSVDRSQDRLISLLSRQLGECFVAGRIPALKGVFGRYPVWVSKREEGIK